MGQNGSNGSPAPAKPACKLVATDGNVFSIISHVRAALRDAGQADRALEFTDRAFRAGSYDEVLQLCFEYVEVE
jgi:hypothetical protein